MLDEYSIEKRATQIFDAGTKEYLSEVSSCDATGNYRSSVVILWSLAVCDLLPAARKFLNTVVLEIGKKALRTRDKLISIGNFPENTFQVQDPSVSRRLAVIVNTANEVWIHDLNSTIGVWTDDMRVKRKRILMGVHDVLIGKVRIRVSARDDLVA